MVVENLDQYAGQWVTITWFPGERDGRNPANYVTRTGILRKDSDLPNMFHLRATKGHVGRNHMIDKLHVVSVTLLKFEDQEESDDDDSEFTPGEEVAVD